MDVKKHAFWWLNSGGGGAPSYYISDVDGDTNNSGLSPNEAKTFSDIPSLDFSTINNLKLKRGETFEGGITVDSSITIGAYGTGDKPKIIRSSALTGFSDEGGGIYSLTAAHPGWLFLSGNVMKLSQTPWIPTNADQPAANQLKIGHNKVSGYSDIVGSYLITYRFPYNVDKIFTVTAYDGAGTITLDKDTTGSIPNGSLLRLLGKTDYFLDDNEWAYEGGQIFVKMSSFVDEIRKSDHSTIIEIESDNVTLQDIELAECYHSAIRIDDALTINNLTIDNCSINNIRTYGVLYLGDGASLTVTDSLIYNIGYDGIYSNRLSPLTIENNTFHDIGGMDNIGCEDNIETLAATIVDTGVITWGNTAVFSVDANNGSFRYNTIYNIGYSGFVNVGSSNTFSYNIIHDFLKNFGDGGAIYLLGGNQNTSWDIPCENNLLFNNIIYNGHGSPYFGSYPIAGIYEDQGTNDNEIYNNVIYDIGMFATTPSVEWDSCGIFTNDLNSYNHIHDNIIVCIKGKTSNAILLRYGGGEPNIGNVFANNVLALRKNTQRCFNFNSFGAVNPFSAGGSSNNNYFFNPYGTTIARKQTTDLTFAQLQTEYGQEANSVTKSNWLTFVSDDQSEEEIKLYTNETSPPVNQLIPAGYEDIDGNDVGGTTIEIPAYSGLLVKLTSSIGKIYTFGDKYALNITAATQGAYSDDATYSFYPKSGSNDLPLSFELWFKTPPSFVTQGYLFFVSDVGGAGGIMYMTLNAGTLAFRLVTNGSNYLQRSIALTANTSYQIVGTYDGSKTIAGLKLFVNNGGSATDTKAGTYTGMPAHSGTAMRIFSPQASLNGGIGEYRNFRYFDIDLSSGQITTLYNNAPLSRDGQTTLYNACKLELQFESNIYAAIGNDATAQGTLSYLPNE